MTEAEKRAFAAGVLTALAVLRVHDAQTMYDEIVGAIGVRALFRACESRSDAEWAGLLKYSYRPNGHDYRRWREAAHV